MLLGTPSLCNNQNVIFGCATCREPNHGNKPRSSRASWTLCGTSRYAGNKPWHPSTCLMRHSLYTTLAPVWDGQALWEHSRTGGKGEGGGGGAYAWRALACAETHDEWLIFFSLLQFQYLFSTERDEMLFTIPGACAHICMPTCTCLYKCRNERRMHLRVSFHQMLLLHFALWQIRCRKYLLVLWRWISYWCCF